MLVCVLGCSFPVCICGYSHNPSRVVHVPPPFSRYERGGPSGCQNGHLCGSQGLLHPRGEAGLQVPDVASGESAESLPLDSEPNQK